jgi:hypothetical protein
LEIIEDIDGGDVYQTQARTATATNTTQSIILSDEITSLAHKTMAQTSGLVFTEVFASSHASKLVQLARVPAATALALLQV